MPDSRIHFDVRASNEKFIRNKGQPDYTGLPATVIRRIQRFRLSAAEINAGFAKARAQLRDEAGCNDASS